MARKPRHNTTGHTAASSAARLSPPPSGVRIRMYRQGHGDCFLLAFRGAQGKPVYVLIDCGYKPGSNGPKYGLKDFQAVLDNIKDATGRRLDLVVITHEHQDHVNGFWKEIDPYFGDFTIGAAWFAWTEDPDDALANELRKRHGDQLLGLVAARNRLAADRGANEVHWLDELLSLELGVQPSEFTAAAKKKKKNPEDSINKQGMKLIKDKAGKQNTRYILPHEGILRLPGVSDVRVFALGPPHDADLLADEDPKGAEGFPGHGMRARASFFAAAEAADPDANPEAASEDIQPFASRFALPLDQASSDPEHGDFFCAHYGDTTAAAPSAPQSLEPGAWRRIDHDWLYSAEDFALYLNRGINNTSLVLAFEFEKSKKVLLFAADAQRGNWISWANGEWKDGDQKITARDLLSRTVLYKVGHHGSHNATLKGIPQDDYANLSWMGHGKYGNELAAMITAVNKWALNVKPKPWVHPLPSIKAALRDKCQGRVFQIDTNQLQPPDNPADAAWQDFLTRARIDSSGLYFEYDIHDE